MTEQCNFFWGSHGCDRTKGAHVTHFCGKVSDPCSIFTETGPEFRDKHGPRVPGEVRFCYQHEGQAGIPRGRSRQDWGGPMTAWAGWYQ